MKANEIRITIQKPRDEVFEYTLEPKNKKFWCEPLETEIVNTKQIGLHSQYRNNSDTFVVSDYEKNLFCEFTNEQTQYQYSYSFRKIDNDTTEVIYFEAMLDGSDLAKVMDKKYFTKLKELLEK